jgi:hypothetical protein
MLRGFESLMFDLGLGTWLGAVSVLLLDGVPDITSRHWQGILMAGLALYFWWLAQTE